MYFAYITDTCRSEAQKHSVLSDVEKQAERVERIQLIDNLDPFPNGFVKKNLGRSFRLIIGKHYDEQGNCLLVFWHVYPKSSDSYSRFLQNTSLFRQEFEDDCNGLELSRIWQEKLASVDANTAPPELSKAEKEFLFSSPGGQQDDGGGWIILESDEWITRTRGDAKNGQDFSSYLSDIQDLVIGALEEEDDDFGNLYEKEGGIGLLCRKIPAEKILFLAAPFRRRDQDDRRHLEQGYQDVLSASSKNILQRKSHRSYPDIVLYDDELWIEKIQKEDEKANLALSAEEAGILQKCRGGHYPLFINGRPGSGKSTILQYLFAEHLYDYDAYRDSLNAPPIYLTYSQELLDTAKENVRAILKSNAKKIVDSPLDDDKIKRLVKNSFHSLRDYLLSLLPEDERFSQDSYVQFPDFRKWYEETFARNPNMRSVSAELAWHVIRTYIKGTPADESEYLDLEGFKELPRDKSVSDKTFQVVEERVWRGYQKWCSEKELWDDQDLVRKLLNLTWENKVVLPEHVAVFCDEAQDFTLNELRLIFRLSLYSRRKLDQHLLNRIPFAFAGDPFQTLNPTGFDWDAIRGNFYQIIRDQLDRSQDPKLEIQFEELSFNYRSRKDIVQLCNFIHLMRGVAFGKPHLHPQETWFEEAANMPVYFDIDSKVFQTQVKNQEETVIILPCQEGDEQVFVENDSFLKTFALGENGQIVRNIFSPMRAKGLEYKRVVLYKFGQTCVDDYPALLGLMDPKRPLETLPSEQKLPLEYFINRLYVAASRARIRLFIADTEEGLTKFWKRFFENCDPRDFVEKYRSVWKPTQKGRLEDHSQYPWVIEDLVKVQPGKQDDWLHDRDDPAALAQEFESQGRSKRDSYILRRAADNYRLAGAEDSALRCDALRLELDEEFLDAGRIWMQLGETKRAKELFWKAKAYAELAKIQDNSLEQRAAQFMLAKEKYNLDDLRQLLTEIDSALTDKLVQADLVWSEIISALYRTLLEASRESDLKPFEWEGLRHLATEHHRKGLLTRDEEIAQLEVRATPYPGKLEVLQRIGAGAKKIVAVFHQNQAVELSDRQVDIVLHALQTLDKSAELESLAEQYPSASRFAFMIAYFARQRKQEDLFAWAERLLALWTQEANWDAALNFVKGKRLEGLLAEKDADLVRNYHWPKYALDVPFIKLLSVSDELVQASPSEQNQVSRYLTETLLQHPDVFSGQLTVQQAGGAIERAGKVMDCLAFYEMIFQHQTWPASEDDQQFARERWLVNKGRQIGITTTDERKLRIQKEINTRAREWNVEISGMPEFPEVNLDAKPKPVTSRPTSRIYTPEPSKEPSDMSGEKLVKTPIKPNLPYAKSASADLEIGTKLTERVQNESPSKTIKIQFEADEQRFRCQLDRSRGKATIQLHGEMEMVTLSADGLTAQGSDEEFSEQVETLRHFSGRAEYFIAPWNITCVLRTLRRKKAVVYVDLYLGRKEFELLSLRLAE